MIGFIGSFETFTSVEYVDCDYGTTVVEPCEDTCTVYLYHDIGTRYLHLFVDSRVIVLFYSIGQVL